MGEKYIYTLTDFINIAFSNPSYKLSENAIKCINELSIKFNCIAKENGMGGFRDKGNTEYRFNSKSHSQSQNREHKGSKENSFTPTKTFEVIKKVTKSDLDDKMSKIRFLLNKLTEKNFNEIYNELNNEISVFVSNEDSRNEEDLEQIGKLIFELASTNKFYSKIYANLFTNLLKSYVFLRPIFEKIVESYKKCFIEIRHSDPNKDYLLFCEITKENEKRKALSLFLVNLSLNDLINVKDIIYLLTDFLKKINELITQDESHDEVNEIAENISILYNKDILTKLNNDSVKEMIIKEIRFIATSKSKDFKSLSSKTIFKFMDLLDM